MQTDSHLSRGAVRNTANRVLKFMGVIPLLCFYCIHVFAGQAAPDYLYPSEANGGFVLPVNSAASTGASQRISSAIEYKAFNGRVYTLLENRGRYVNVLVPGSFSDGPFFTRDHLEELVDRLDLLYAIYADLIGDEPSGIGLLNVAFVPETCGLGCGMLGWKGVELSSEALAYESIIRELDAGRLDRLLLHELAHNFDIYATILHYLPDHAHAWTEMFEYFAPHRYSRINTHGAAPDDLYSLPMTPVWKTFVTEDKANWDVCVRDGNCTEMGMTANKLWAMLYYRIEAVHGIEAVLRSFEYLTDYVRTGAVPFTENQREGLRILSLAVGVGANISCYVDALKLPLPSATRKELQKRFGDGDSLCTDFDRDGFTAINGDCDDTAASINILQTEISDNDLDDDCDELVDEAHWVESQEGGASDDFEHSVTTDIPFEVSGSMMDQNDRDEFVFGLSETRRALVTFCAKKGFRGWVVALQPNGRFLEADHWFNYLNAPGCISSTFDFGEFTRGGLLVMPDASAGGYSLTVSNADGMIPDYSTLVRVTPLSAGGMRLQAGDRDGMFTKLGADEVEFWISGIAGRLIAPFNAGGSVVLNNVTAPSIREGEIYQVRVRPLANGLPLAAFSTGYLFRYDPSPAALPVLDHRYSGAWYDPEHNGEGFIVEMLDDGRAVVYWFTYRRDGSQRWMLGIGSVEGNRITVARLKDTRGGRFGAGFDPNDVVMREVGSLELSFLDCSTALVNYSVDQVGGHQRGVRLTQVYGHRCDDAGPVAGVELNGSWYDPAHSGEGFIVQQVSADEAVVVWFTYNETGEQSWMLRTGNVDNGKLYIPALQRPLGGMFGRSFDPADVVRHEWGELTMQLGCHSGNARYLTREEGYSDGAQSLVRLTWLAKSACND